MYFNIEIIEGMNNRMKPAGFNNKKEAIENNISSGSMKNNWNKKKIKTANPNTTKNKSALTLHRKTSNIIKYSNESKNSMVH